MVERTGGSKRVMMLRVLRREAMLRKEEGGFWVVGWD
jgi:hypothetical protein